MIDPFFGVRGCPDQQKIFDCGAYVEVLGYDYDARTQPLLAEAGEMRGHGLAIMGNQNPFRFRRDPEHVRIAKADNTALMSAQDIDRGLPPAQAQDDLVVEIGVSRLCASRRTIRPQPGIAASCRGRMSTLARFGKLPIERRIGSTCLLSQCLKFHLTLAQVLAHDFPIG